MPGTFTSRCFVIIALASAPLVVGCSNDDDKTSPQPAGTTTPATGDAVDTDNVNHSTERMLLGGTATAPDRAATPTDDQSKHDLLVDMLLTEVENEQPGTLAAFDARLASQDPNIFARAVVDFYNAAYKAGTTDTVQAAVTANPALHTNTTDPAGSGSSDEPKQPTATADPSKPATRKGDLDSIDKGGKAPDPSSRLGAYESTRDYKSGTVGSALHGVIGTFYKGLGSTGEEKFGDFVKQPDVQALLDKPLSDANASKQFADKEWNYWKSQPATSVGGWMGWAVPPTVRDLGLRYLPWR